MSVLSDQDCVNIKQYPLEPVIRQLKTALLDLSSKRSLHSTTTEQNESSLSERNDDGPHDNDGDTTSRLREILMDLIASLQVHRVAKQIRSPTTRRPLNLALASLNARVACDDVPLFSFTPLTEAFSSPSSTDVAIWKAVLDVITSTSPQTPPRSVSASFSGTPRTHSPGSHQHTSEQTRQLLEPALRQELHDCTYERVDGFFDRFFTGSWVDASDAVYEKMKAIHQDGRWDAFPNPPAELPVWEWWSRIQEQYLQGCRGIYYTTRSKAELTGNDADRQLDMFVKHRDCASEERHDWADVRVVGEHKVSCTDRNAKLMQLARYVRDIFKTQPTRPFVHGFLLLGTSMEVWVFDRSGAYSAEPFDIHEQPRRFVRVLCGYVMMSDKELGLDTFVQQGESGTRAVVVQDEPSKKRKRLVLETQPMFVHVSIVGRGTSCYQTVPGDEEESKRPRKVIKFAWGSTSRRPEADYLRDACQRNVRGVVRLVGAENITDISSIRKGLTFIHKRKILTGKTYDGSSSLSRVPLRSTSSNVQKLSLQDGKRHSSDAGDRQRKISRSGSRTSKLKESCSAQDQEQHEQPLSASSAPTPVAVGALGAKASAVAPRSSPSMPEPFRNRMLTCLVLQPAGRPLHTFRNVPELLRCFRDAIKAHRSLLVDGRILHRDISLNNIVITDPADANGYYGMLIDMDLATNVDAEGKNQRSGASKMTGTLKYMAIEVLELAFRDNKRQLDHTYRHDLESFFYVFLDICINYGQRKLKSDPLKAWYIGTYKEMAFSKRGQMAKGGFGGSFITEFAPALDCVRPLALELRSILFLEGDIYTGTPQSHSILYERMTKAIDDAARDLEARAPPVA